MIDTQATLGSVKFRILLVLWTLGIWGSRIRNLQADDDLVGFERGVAMTIATSFLILATVSGAAILRESRWLTTPLLALVILGIARWTVRGPIILFSSEWSAGFKVVHTVLWLMTLALSILAWREHRNAEGAEAR